MNYEIRPCSYLINKNLTSEKNDNLNNSLDTPNKRKCSTCLLIEPIVRCDTCFCFLCRACLIEKSHPLDHKLSYYDLQNGCYKESDLRTNEFFDRAEKNTDYVFSKKNLIVDAKNKSVHVISEKHTDLAKTQTASCNCKFCYNCLKKNNLDSYEDPSFDFDTNFKVVPTDQQQLDAYLKNVSVCETCNFQVVNEEETEKHKKEKHVILTPEAAQTKIQDILRNFADYFAPLAEKLESILNQCVQFKCKLPKEYDFIDDHLEKAFLLSEKAIENNKLRLLSSLEEFFQKKTEELKKLDDVLYWFDNELTERETTIAKIISLAKTSKVQAINMWRNYERQNNMSGNKNLKHKPNALIYEYRWKYIEEIENSIKNCMKIAQKYIVQSGNSVKTFINVATLKYSKLDEKLNEDINSLQVESLRDFQMLQYYLNIPVKPTKGQLAVAMTYGTSLGKPIAISGFGRMDTFHKSWDKVICAIYKSQVLAIYSNVAINRTKPTPNSNKVMPLLSIEGNNQTEQFLRSPPENLLQLNQLNATYIAPKSEYTENSINNTVTPIGKIMEYKLEIPALEITKIVNEVIVGWWVLVHSDKSRVLSWIDLINNYKTENEDSTHVYPRASSRSIPTTNPGITPEDLGISQPIIGNHWAVNQLFTSHENEVRK